MCGIVGFISTTWDENTLEDITSRLSHRGPDAAGQFFDKPSGIGLGHRRLSILDLSDDANQPFRSRDGRYILVYNGEVYNYRELTREIDYSPRTSSDTEILIELFSRFGPSCFSKLNGMFAGAIWDSVEKKLTLFRDRLGIKPLFLLENNSGIAFASELKALIPLSDNKWNPGALAGFLQMGFVPGGGTFYKNIRKFPPGHFGIYSTMDSLIETFWKARDEVSSRYTFSTPASAKKHLRELLNSSVAYRMIADVPVGVFLSGGVDSSTVASIAQKTTSKSIKTFSIGFKESAFNEAQHARAVAEYLGTDHHEFLLSERDALERVDAILDVYDEPYADSSAFPTLLVSEMARKHVIVALAGDGGDELFHGYGMYNWARRLENPFLRMLKYPVATALSKTASNRNRRAAELFRWKSNTDKAVHIFSQEQSFFSSRELDALLVQPAPGFSFTDYPEVRGLNPAERQAFFDLVNYLPDDLLVKVDRASMYHGLEVRVPLLDHRIVEFALNLHPSLKMKNGVQKVLLKQVLFDLIPEKFFNRPKWGFSIPLGKWLTTDLKYLVDRYLDRSVIESAGIVAPEEVDKIKKRYFDGEEFLYNRIWALVLLHRWIQEHGSR